MTACRRAAAGPALEPHTAAPRVVAAPLRLRMYTQQRNGCRQSTPCLAARHASRRAGLVRSIHYTLRPPAAAMCGEQHYSQLLAGNAVPRSGRGVDVHGAVTDSPLSAVALPATATSVDSVAPSSTALRHRSLRAKVARQPRRGDALLLPVGTTCRRRSRPARHHWWRDLCPTTHTRVALHAD